MPPLSIMLWLPAACGLLGALASLVSERGAGRAGGAEADRADGDVAAGWSIPGIVAFAGSLGALGLAIAYIADYSAGGPALQHVTDVVWIAELGIHYKLAITGLNVFLIGLTTLLFAAAIFASNIRSGSPPPARPRLFYFHFMLAESAVIGAFLAQDLALFVAFFDLMLIPFYFLIGTDWDPAHPRPGRVRATIKLVIYTLVGSLLMLAAAIATGVLAAQHGGVHITFVLTALQIAAAEHRLAGVDLPVLRRGVPRQDARLPPARLDARRLPRDADRGADGVLGGAVEGRRIRLPGDRAAAVPARRRPLPDADAADRAGLDPVRLAAGVQPDRRAPDRRVLLGGAARLHHARDLRPQRPGRSGRATADGQPRPRRRAAAVHRRTARPSAPAARRTCARWAGSRSARRCSRRSS